MQDDKSPNQEYPLTQNVSPEYRILRKLKKCYACYDQEGKQAYDDQGDFLDRDNTL